MINKKYTQQIMPYLVKARDAYRGLSPREQKLLLGAVAVVVIFMVFSFIQPIQNMFLDQSLELSKAEQEVHNIAVEINRYQRLKLRRSQVEQEFKSVEIKEGALSHLESLVKDKAGIAQGAFTIKDQPPKPFGAGYQQTFFSVNFSTTDYPRLIDFLKELVDGPKPLVVKRLDLKRTRGGDKLEIDLEISSITKDKQGEASVL